MTYNQIAGAQAAIHTAHPTSSEATDLAMARARGMSNADITSAYNYLTPTGG